MDSLFLSERELAKRWGVARSSVQRLREAGRLAYFAPTPGRIAYRVADVEAYERDHTTDAVTVTMRRARP